MDGILTLLRIGGALTITGLTGVGLQIVAILLAVRLARRKEPTRPGVLPILLAGAGLLALLVVCYLLVLSRWETVTAATEG